MKHTKKMKLIEIDDNNISSYSNNNSCVDDENYSKPRTLSSLDNIMNEILRAPIISDADKWVLYSQALQKYLNRVKISSQKSSYNTSYPERANSNVSPLEDTFNFSLPGSAISGVEPIRDSLDSITQPVVRNFFEIARKTNTSVNQILPNDEDVEMLPVTPKMTSNRKAPKRKKKKASGFRQQPSYLTRSRAQASKRRAEKTLSSDLSSVRPFKIVLRDINWEPSTAR